MQRERSNKIIGTINNVKVLCSSHVKFCDFIPTNVKEREWSKKEEKEKVHSIYIYIYRL